MELQDLFPNYKFRADRWKCDGSNSHGTDWLYRGMECVRVRIFPEEEQASAYGTHFFLKESGVSTAEFQKIQHVTDGRWYYYVFADQNQMLSLRDNAYPELHVAC